MNSKMPQIYVHWFGNESSNTLLELYGVTCKQNSIQELRPRYCPHCKEPNKIDSKFCSNCQMVLTYSEYLETVEKRNEIEMMKIKHEKEINLMNQKLNKIMTIVQENPNLVHIKPEALVNLENMPD